jgi:hypothetical protein
MRMIIKQDGKRRAFGPFLIKLWQLAIAVVPKGKVYPKNGFLPGRGISSSQGLHVAQGLILCAGRRTKQERFFPGNGLPTAPEEFQAPGVGKGNSFPDKAISDEQGITKRNGPLGQFRKGGPIDSPLFVERSYQRQD